MWSVKARRMGGSRANEVITGRCKGKSFTGRDFGRSLSSLLLFELHSLALKELAREIMLRIFVFWGEKRHAEIKEMGKILTL